MKNTNLPTLFWGAPGFAVTLWCFLDPTPYVPCIVICGLLPWIGLLLVLLSGGQLVFSGQKGEKRTDLFVMIFLPALALGARALMDYHLLDWKPALIAAVAVSLVWNLVIWVARRGERPRGFVVMTICLLIFGVDYGYGVVTFSDVLGDSTVAASYKARVLDKHVSRGRSTSYDLDLSAWGNDGQDDESVPRELYNAVAPGDSVCIDVHPGRFGLRSYDIHKCTTAPGA